MLSLPLEVALPDPDVPGVAVDVPPAAVLVVGVGLAS